MDFKDNAAGRIHQDGLYIVSRDVNESKNCWYWKHQGNERLQGHEGLNVLEGER